VIGRLEYVEILVEGTDFIIIPLEYEVFKKQNFVISSEN
jgi:hypothetical protein